ncbi:MULTISPECIES: branched-chain amino acid ABC transporter substrate-binding protein [Chryseobacterium]|uniref:branched-chain amino acid ABC transporter substrate-binding protein n=1 Tax=Chryseobacterium TaxID=59732 RepID=UPI00195E7696|nr:MULTISPECIES: branched-chain amino acid ABC transporter substrate-binding protein [Chryseobacterium]MBM7420999.1 glucan phosphoethanolaminetransferase (alkaline phosphatase superfamily) [Chryseobacterium sp. JUb44]MDH6210957.1 glucan phosphoethanolaminetransferase (alkaline phosphatase superfamily) [Chryseobacterium sp. BIGb0186]WSO09624.1 branched-chain amino acid ABC transporter substrate-binding protein [Chryseobacterium scophthalmum]
MPFDFLDGLAVLAEFLSFGSSSKSSSDSEKNTKSSKKSKYTTELWSGSFLVIASILYFIVLKDPFPEENYIQSVLICTLIGFAISFILFFSLYHLGLFYFKSLFKLILFSSSVILLVISFVLFMYYQSGIFL